MYIGNLKPSDEFHSLVLQAIRDIGIKHRHKKNHFIKSAQEPKYVTKDTKIFRRPLCALTTKLVTLKSGAAIEVPSFVVEACCHIKHRCDVEGVFRKAGSAARLREIKAIVDCGKPLESQHHVIDVSNILKLFFRELPEPLLPYVFHDLLLRCLLLKDKATEAILLTCLLFPPVHLNTLVYLLEFFRDVADNEESNKMGISNLAIIITPSLMPVEEKIVNSGIRLGHHVRVIELLLHNNEKIGFLPEPLMGKALTNGCVLSTNEEMEVSENEESKVKKKKKRRSGSLTRMINGLKKMVGKGSPDVDERPVTSTPDFSSPCVKSAKKRKLLESSGAFSSKKKRDILRTLPQSVTLANAPCTPLPAAIGELHYTPRIYSHPNPYGKSKSPRHKQKSKKFFSFNHHNEKDDNVNATKSENRLKSRLSVSRKSAKKSKKMANSSSNDNKSDTSTYSEKEHRSSLDWQWKNGPWKRKKCPSSSDTPVSSTDLLIENKSSDSMFCSESASGTSVFEAGVDLSSSSDTEFVKIPKSEYEEIKNRVSAIENRISQEFGCIAADPVHDLDNIPLIDESEDEMCRAKKVQNAYEKTLEESEKLGDPVTTDQLAKRLGKELKIRHSLENKVIRSPSARKIGTIRRRSREIARTSLDKSSKNNSPKHVVRQASVKHDLTRMSGQEQTFYSKSTLKRGRPNTVYSGLPHPSPLRAPTAITAEHSEVAYEYNQKSFGMDGESSNGTIIDNVVNSSNNSSLIESSKPSQHYDARGSAVSEITPRRCEVRRASSFHGTDVLNSIVCDIKKSISQGDMANTASSCENQLLSSHRNNSKSTEGWENASEYFSKCNVQNVPVSGRESVAKIRSQNAGLVLSRMRLFDKKQDPSQTPSRTSYIQIGNEEKLESNRVVITKNNTQSLRIQCIQDNFLDKLNLQCASGERRQSVRLKSAMGSPASHSQTLKGSPKKIGSPRKKYLSQKSPKCVTKKQKHKSSKSPPKERSTSQARSDRTIKKFNSLRETSNRSPLTSKINMTAPSSVLNCGKENLTSPISFGTQNFTQSNNVNYDGKSEILQHVHLPENLKETIYDVCTPKVEKLHKMSMSPLKDSNRIYINSMSQFEGNRMNAYKTPKSTPYIKKPLLVKSPTEIVRTPYCRTPALEHRSHRSATPMKALPNLTVFTPVAYKE